MDVVVIFIVQQIHRHSFNGLFLKDETNLDFNEARDDGVAVASDYKHHKQIICTSLQADNHASSP